MWMDVLKYASTRMVLSSVHVIKASHSGLMAGAVLVCRLADYNTLIAHYPVT